MRAAYEAGVTVLAGTDLPPGHLSEEVRWLAEAGLPAEVALGAASWNARRFLGLPSIDEGQLPTSGEPAELGNRVQTITLQRHRYPTAGKTRKTNFRQRAVAPPTWPHKESYDCCRCLFGRSAFVSHRKPHSAGPYRCFDNHHILPAI